MLIIACIWSTQCQADVRRAFVVGIDQYDNFSAERQLDNAVSDANAVAEKLTAVGFDEVTADQNLTRFEFNNAWQSFLDSIESGDTVAFFYSGHGVAIDGKNYLLPRSMPDLQAGRSELIKSESLSLNSLLLDIQKRRPAVTLMILDACRNDPFASAEMSRDSSMVGGLAGSNDPPSGTFIMYSAAAGMVALDGIPGDDQPHSVYTRHLLDLIPRGDLTIAAMARELRQRVNETTRKTADGFQQSPAYYDGLVGDFCLPGCNNHENSKPATATDTLSTPDQSTSSRNTATDSDWQGTEEPDDVAATWRLDADEIAADLEPVSRKDKRAAAASRRKGKEQFWRDPVKSLSAYRRATELNPNNEEGWNQLGRLLQRAEDIDAALVAYQHAEKVAVANQNQDWLAISMDNIGGVYQLKGEFEKTEYYYNRALELGADKARSASTYSRLGSLKMVRGDLVEAQSLFLQSLKLFKEVGDKEEIAGQYGRLGIVYRHYGDLDKSESYHLKALKIQKKLKSKSRVAGQYSSLALLYRDRGDSEKSEQYHLQAMELYESLKDQASLADQYGLLGILYEGRGELDRAEDALKKSLQLFQQLGRDGQIAYQNSKLGHLYRQRKDYDTSEAYYRNALEIYESLDRKGGMAEQYGLLGELYRLRGESERARTLWSLRIIISNRHCGDPLRDIYKFDIL